MDVEIGTGEAGCRGGGGLCALFVKIVIRELS
jgi:hypothetical protein